MDADLIETTGNGSGTKYILHKKHNVSVKDKVLYAKQKKQNKTRQKEAILRYLDEWGSITNAEVCELLKIPKTQSASISRLLKSMREEGIINYVKNSNSNKHTVIIPQTA